MMKVENRSPPIYFSGQYVPVGEYELLMVNIYCTACVYM